MATSAKKKTPKKNIQFKQQKKSSVSRIVAVRIGLPFFLLAVLRIVAAFFPEERLWGINHLAFLPEWSAIILAVAGLLFCTPLLYRPYTQAASLFFDGESRPARIAIPIILSLTAGILFWIFRMHTYFLGDGAVYLAEHFRYTRDLPVSEDVLYSKYSAPLTGWILATIAKLIISTSATESINNNPQFTFWIVGALTGVVFTFIVCRASYSLSDRSDERFSYFKLLMFSAGTLFFFGYVEYYTFFFTAITLYFYLIIRALEKKVHILLPILVLAFAAAFHFMALLAVPSLVFVLLARSEKPSVKALIRGKYVAGAVIFIMLIAGLYYFLSGTYAGGSRVFMSLFAFGREESLHTYTLLSSYHLIDVINYLFLIAAPLIVGAAYIAKKESFQSPEVLVSIVNIVFFFFLAFFGFMGFGMARDWDVNAVLGIAITFFLISITRHVEASASKSYLLYVVVGAMATGSFTWFAVNIYSQSSVERYKTIVGLDDKHIAGDYALNGYEHLRKYYFSVSDKEGIAWAIKKKIESVGYPVDYRKLVIAALDGLPPMRQREYFDWMFDRLFAKIEHMNKMSIDASYEGAKDDFVEVAVENILQCHYLPSRNGFGEPYVRKQMERMETLLPGNAIVDIARGQIDWDQAGVISDPAKFSRGARQITSSATLCLYAGRALVNVKDFAAAKSILERGYKQDSTFTLPLLYLAVAELQLSPENSDRAEGHLIRFLGDPAGRRLSHARETEQHLVQYAENLLQHIRGLRMQGK